MKSWILLGCALFLPVSVFAADKNNFPTLHPGETARGRVRIQSGGGVSYSTYVVDVPEDAVTLEIRIEDAQADLDLYAKHGTEIDDYDYVDASSITDDNNEVLRISRTSSVPLKPGRYFVDVVYQLGTRPIDDRGRPLSSLPFSLETKILTARIVDIHHDEPATFVLEPERGMAAYGSIDVPPGVPALRIDVIDATADVDLLLSRNHVAYDRPDAEYVRESRMSKEKFVLVNPPAGTWYLGIIDQVGEDYSEQATVLVQFEDLPPSVPTAVHEVPHTSSPALSRAVEATVEVIGESVSGSGCVVDPAGYIITNYHVVRNDLDEVVIAVTGDVSRPPVESYRARVLHYREDADLALLKVVSGLYGEALPPNFSMPAFTIAQTSLPDFGDEILFLGYPSIGGNRSRPSVTMTRGLVSGFENTPTGDLYKTDGVIASGNSGGAALTSDLRLFGIPTAVIGEEGAQIGYIVPLSMMPEDWQRVLGLTH